MTKYKLPATFFYFSILSLFLTACQEDDQPLEYKTQGYIKGTFTGVSSNNVYTFNEKFNFNQFKLDDGSYYTYSKETGYNISISRNDYNQSNFCRITFQLKEEALQTPENVYVTFRYHKEEKNKVIVFSSYPMYSNLDKDIIFSGFTFDPISGRTKAIFSLTNKVNSTAKEATITGEFDVIVRELVE